MYRLSLHPVIISLSDFARGLCLLSDGLIGYVPLPYFNILDLLSQPWRWMQAFNGRFLQLVSLTFFLLVRSSTYFPWGMEFAIFRLLFLADGSANCMTQRLWNIAAPFRTEVQCSTGVGLTSEATHPRMKLSYVSTSRFQEPKGGAREVKSKGEDLARV